MTKNDEINESVINIEVVDVILDEDAIGYRMSFKSNNQKNSKTLLHYKVNSVRNRNMGIMTLFTGSFN